MNDGSQEYVLVTGAAGAARLALLHATYGESTETLLREIGLSAGMRALDLGCGAGTVSRWMARQVGFSGEVLGIDISAAQVEVARSEAARQQLSQLRFQVGAVYDTGLPRNHFDLVYCRFLLCHIGEPEAALREMHALLKPGGWGVVEDVDLASFACDPPSPELHRMRDVMIELGRTRGVDYCLGPRLHRIFRHVGFAQPTIRMQQPVHSSGEEKRFWEFTFLEAAPAMLQAGLMDGEQLARLSRVMAEVAQDPNTLVMQARKVQIWARK